MPIPYMGSKRKSSGMIFQTIKNLNPTADILVDLFCGGFAISEEFIKNGWKVIANDKNKYVSALIKKTVNEGLDENIVTKWVSREMFHEILYNPDKYDDWYVGFISCIWSFGNQQKGYLFGKEIEIFKKAGHELVIEKNPYLLKKLQPNFPQKYIEGIIKQSNWHKRRSALAKVARKLKSRIFELEQLQRLQQLERLEQLQQLEIYSVDYCDIKIPEKAIIYCDPPYQNTAEYKENGFNHLEFWEWCRQKSKFNKIYISEYSAPNDFKKVLEFEQNSTLLGGNNKKQPNECLFTI